MIGIYLGFGICELVFNEIIVMVYALCVISALAVLGLWDLEGFLESGAVSGLGAGVLKASWAPSHPSYGTECRGPFVGSSEG